MSPAVGFRDATAIAGIAQTEFRQAPRARPKPSWPARSSWPPAPTPGSMCRRSTLCARTRWRRPKRSTSPGTSAAGRSPSSPRSVTGAGRMRGGRARGVGGGHGPGRGGGGLAGPEAGLGAAAVDEHVDAVACAGAVDAAGGVAASGGRDRHAHAAVHARLRGHPGSPGQCGHGRAGPRQHEPQAMMYAKKMSREDYMASRWVSEPLCLFDNCLETDGALACVIVSAERARDLKHPPVYVHAFAQGAAGAPDDGQLLQRRSLTGPAWACASGCGPTPTSVPTMCRWPRSTTPSRR